jgi:CubicO group peptidase (beta-lactamase class C family)
VEKIVKKPFNEYCKANVFKPLGMKKTRWYIHEVDTLKYIRPHVYVTQENRQFLINNKRLFHSDSSFGLGSYIQTCLYSFPNYPDGLVRTSVKELSLFLAAMMNGGELNGKRILKKETVDKMLSLQVEGDKSQGLTWRKYELDSLSRHIPLWGHSGSDPGITTNLVFNPVDKIGVITFQNNATGGSFSVVAKLYRATINQSGPHSSHVSRD